MSFSDFLKKIFGFIPFNIFDYIMIVLLAIYVWEDTVFGLISAGIGFLSTISAFFLGLVFYPFLSKLIVSTLSFTKGISDAIAFLICACIAFVVVSFSLSIIRKKYIKIEVPRELDIIGGAVFGFLSFFFISSFAISLLLSFPVSTVIKNSIRSSFTGRLLFANTQGMESYVRTVFGGAIEDTINFLTVEPSSNEQVSLNFKTTSGKIDKAGQAKMLEILNQERTKRGLPPLVVDDNLTVVAQKHGKDMLARGYFSHYTPEGLSPFDRMAQYGIDYNYAGENLALAPDVQIAMDGLMKSPGHRANILSPNFKRTGIGVIDAGIYGEMWVQEFTD